MQQPEQVDIEGFCAAHLFPRGLELVAVPRVVFVGLLLPAFLLVYVHGRELCLQLVHENRRLGMNPLQLLRWQLVCDKEHLRAPARDLS
jgi:hypothetical protein